jgi:hypothetical protein
MIFFGTKVDDSEDQQLVNLTGARIRQPVIKLNSLAQEFQRVFPFDLIKTREGGQQSRVGQSNVNHSQSRIIRIDGEHEYATRTEHFTEMVDLTFDDDPLACGHHLFCKYSHGDALQAPREANGATALFVPAAPTELKLPVGHVVQVTRCRRLDAGDLLLSSTSQPDPVWPRARRRCMPRECRRGELRPQESAVRIATVFVLALLDARLKSVEHFPRCRSQHWRPLLTRENAFHTPSLKHPAPGPKPIKKSDREVKRFLRHFCSNVNSRVALHGSARR